MFFDFEFLFSGHRPKLLILYISGNILLASAPGTGAIGDKESEEAPDKQAFHNLFGWNTFHKPTLGEIEE